MRFDDLFVRASISDLQSLLGSSATKLINLLDPKSSSSSIFRDVVLNLYGRHGLLLNPKSRSILLDLLRPDEAKRLAQVIGLSPNNNVYEQLKTLKYKQNQLQALFDYLVVAMPEVEQVIAKPSLESVKPHYPLFRHQREAARRVKDKLSYPPYRTILHMPTGAGKTRTTMNIITDHLRACEPSVVIWLANSEELCEQAIEEFIQAWSTLGDRPLDTYRFWGQHSFDPSEVTDGVIVAGLAKTYSAAMKSAQFISEMGKRASLVVIDEAHSAIAPTYRLVLDTLTVFRKNAALLGLTATPGRTWADVDTDRELASFFASQKVTLQIEGYDNPVDYLVDEQYLAKVRYTPLHYTEGEELSETDLAKIQQSFDIPESILKKLADDELRNLMIVQKVEQLIAEHKRIIVFAATVGHSDLLASIFRARGIDARSVTSQSTSIERKLAIEAFKDASDATRILCNYGVLTTGFDAPRTSAAVIARPTKSLVLYSQMVGRAIRGKKAGGNEHAEIVTVVDFNLPGFGSVAEAFNNWEDIWE